jgi:hypothetical protein
LKEAVMQPQINTLLVDEVARDRRERVARARASRPLLSFLLPARRRARHGDGSGRAAEPRGAPAAS